MADFDIDFSPDDDGINVVSVENPHAFALRVDIGAVSLTFSHDQARAVFDGLRPFFEENEA